MRRNVGRNDPNLGHGGGTTPTVALNGASTTGNVTNGSPTLTVLNGSAFTIGDPILVTAQTYTRDSEGPGGSNAATAPLDPNLYYTEKKQPKGLATIISNKVANTITMADNAGATMAVNVRYDSYDDLAALTGPGNILPVGHFYMRPDVDFPIGVGDDLEIIGQGINATVLEIPIGFRHGFFGVSECSNILIRDIQFQGNMALTGMVCDASVGNEYGYGLNFTNCNTVTVQDCKFVDIPQMDIRFFDGTAGTGDPVGRLIARRCAVVRTFPDQRYIQWHFDAVDIKSKFDVGDDYSVLFEDCTFTAPCLMKAFEMFSANYVKWVRPVLNNGIWSFNSMQHCEVVDNVQTFSAGCLRNDMRNPIIPQECQAIQITNHIGESDPSRSDGSGCTISIDHVDIAGLAAGTIGAANGTAIGFIKTDNSADILITGTYDPTVPDDGLRKGWIRGPWDDTIPLGQYGPTTIMDGGARLVFDGVRVFAHHAATGTDQGAINVVEVYDSGQYWEIFLKDAISDSDTGSTLVDGLLDAVHDNYWKFNNSGKAMIGTEVISYTKVDDTHMNITARGVDGSTAASHSIDDHIKYLDESYLNECVIDEPVSFDADGVPDNTVDCISNADYEALTTGSPAGQITITNDLAAVVGLTFTNDLGAVSPLILTTA